MAARKSLETMSGVILNRLQPTFAAKLVANDMQPVRGKGVCSDSNGESNRTATSDGSAQKLGNDVWYDSESIATKVCSQIGRK